MRRRRATLAIVAWAAALALGSLSGCGGGDGGRDGGSDDAGADADGSPDGGMPGVMPPTAPEEAAEPAPARLAPCREGWRETELPDGATVCEPFPDPRPDCGADEASFPGGGGCEQVGSACPDGEWAEDLPASGVLYVRAGGGSGGSGTRDDPFFRIDTALAAADDGDVIALGKGAYDEEVVLSGDVQLRGACAAETTLSSSRARPGYGVVEVTSGNVGIADVTLTGPDRQGLRFEGVLEATVEGVRIENAALMGLGVFSGAKVTARDLVVRGTATASDGTAGRGIGLEDGAELTLERAVIADNYSEGIAVLGSRLQATDVAIRGTKPVGDFGDGLSVALGATVEGTGIVLEDNAVLGLFAGVEDPEVTLSDVVVRDNGDAGVQIGPRATGSVARAHVVGNGDTGLTAADAVVTAADVVVRANAGRGLLSQDGADLEVLRAWIADNEWTGISVVSSDSSPAAMLSLQDGTFRNGEGPAVQVQGGGSARLSRVRSTGSLGTAFVFRDPDTSVTASDLVVLDPRRLPDAEPLEDRARGVEVRVGAEATLERVRIERARELGLFVEEGSVTVRDITVRDTTARDDIDRELGRGIELSSSTATIERAQLERNKGSALQVSGGSATISDLRATETSGAGRLRLSGKGLIANGGAQVELTRAQLERNREVSIAVFEEGTRLSATELLLLDTLERDCVDDVCPDNGAGIGAGVYLGAEMQLERFRVSKSALVGVQLAEGVLSLRSGVVSDNPVGVNLQPPDAVFDEIARDVALVDNDLGIDATHLPVPEPAVPASDGP